MERQFPTGRFTYVPHEADLNPFIKRLETLPERLVRAWEACPEELRDEPYRLGGWTRRTVVHHVADSHLNMYVRIKLALTEDEPTVKPYDENAWAALGPDGPVELSLQLVQAIHGRVVPLLRSLTAEDFDRRYDHPELLRTVPLREVVQMYAWHGDHHLAHIQLPAL
ncbi:MAG: YfiT family bacillithiol transferase [Schleiferiaceae bacterium]